ncbi:MAG: peptidoglycan DD-metalloendopeptidase family protein [Rhodospirillales bacterium]|nr:peptidoglycan DD-metalloendopeptidase family protein [Rhodospirillales bacterium]
MLATACAALLVCGPASQGLALDADFPGGLGAGGQMLGGPTEVAAAPDDPFVSREITLSGFVEDSFEASLVRAGAPPDLSLKLKDALSSALDRRHRDANQLDSSGTFYVRYRQTFATDGREIGAGRIVFADVMTAARGRIAVHGFRPTRGAEQLWLASGESLAAPAMRLPLETVSVSSAFGVRADPFEQPRHGLGAPSRLGTVGATINTATARGIALGLAPGPGRSASRGGAAFLMHNGVDLVAPAGTPVLAAASGTVVGAAPNAGYGNWIRIAHARNVATVYGHLSAFAPGVSAGVKVQRGQVIGFVGNTGRSTGPHLHFEVIDKGQAIDPMTFPRTKRARLKGADLERFRKLVRQSEAARQGDAAFRRISAGGVP